jgi:hypothetical protein
LPIGAPVEIVVDEGFLDADGRPLTGEFARRYQVGADVRALIDPRHWDLEVPAEGTREPLVVRFDRPLDRALLQHCLWVLDGHGVEVSGRISVADGERSWVFATAIPWTPATYRLAVNPILEDLAGNSLVRVFDRDLARGEHAPRTADRVTIDFIPGVPFANATPG